MPTADLPPGSGRCDFHMQFGDKALDVGPLVEVIFVRQGANDRAPLRRRYRIARG